MTTGRAGADPPLMDNEDNKLDETRRESILLTKSRFYQIKEPLGSIAPQPREELRRVDVRLMHASVKFSKNLV